MALIRITILYWDGDTHSVNTYWMPVFQVLSKHCIFPAFQGKYKTKQDHFLLERSSRCLQGSEIHSLYSLHFQYIYFFEITVKIKILPHLQSLPFFYLKGN